MKATIALEISASHLTATLTLGKPGWGRRAVHTLGSKLQRGRKPITQSEASTATEVASWVPGATRSETIQASLEACAQALQALRARHPGSLDGCHITVRTGLSSSYLGVAAMDLSSPSARSDHHLGIIAKALSREALGMEAAGHEVRWRIQVDQAHVCVMTLETAMITGLDVLAKAQRMKLTSCQPAIAQTLSRELKKSLREQDARTLVWTEHDASGYRHAAVTFIRLVNGSAVNAWCTATQTPPPAEDPWLQPALDRFLIASGAGVDEKIVPSTLSAYPAEVLTPVAASELAV